MRWSVGIEAEGDRVLTREEVVELADAVAANGGIATGIGTSRFGAQLIVEADQPRGGDREGDRGVLAGGPAGRPAGRRRWCGPRRSARTRTPPDDPARLAGRVPVRGAPAAGRLDAAGRGGGVRDRLQARAGRQAGQVRGHLRGSLRRPVGRAVPVPAPARALLDQARRVQVEGLHLHLRGARRRQAAPGADRQGADRDLPAPVQRPAVRPGVEGRVDRRDHLVLPRPGQGPGAAGDRRPARPSGRSRPRPAGATGASPTRAGPARAPRAPRAWG